MKAVAHDRHREPGLDRVHLLPGALAVLRELAVEVPQRLPPVDLALLDLVELFLHARGVLGLEEVLEALLHQVDHQPAERGGDEAAFLLAHVLALLDLAQDVGVGGGPADAVLLHELHERGLVEARRRLGLVALRLRLAQRERVALGNLWQPDLGVVSLALILGCVLRLGLRDLAVEPEEARVLEHGAVGAQQREIGGAFAARLDLDGGHLAHGRVHLATRRSGSRSAGRA